MLNIPYNLILTTKSIRLQYSNQIKLYYNRITSILKVKTNIITRCSEFHKLSCDTCDNVCKDLQIKLSCVYR